MEKYLEVVLEKGRIAFTRDDLTPQTRFKEDLSAKSLTIAQLMNMLEDEYDIEIPYMEFKRCATFEDAAALLKTLDEE